MEQFVPLVYENPFGVASLRVYQAEQFVYLSLNKQMVEPVKMFTTHVSSGSVITNPFTAYSEKAPVWALVNCIIATSYMDKRYGALLKESKESATIAQMPLSEFAAAKPAVLGLIMDDNGLHYNKSTLA